MCGGLSLRTAAGRGPRSCVAKDSQPGQVRCGPEPGRGIMPSEGAASDHQEVLPVSRTVLLPSGARVRGRALAERPAQPADFLLALATAPDRDDG
jgi:hypothetical protein